MNRRGRRDATTHDIDEAEDRRERFADHFFSIQVQTDKIRGKI